MQKKLRVLLADDHEFILHGMKAFMEYHQMDADSGYCGLEVTGVGTPDEVLATYTGESHDVVVLDISFGENRVKGIELARQILGSHPGAAIVMHSQHDQVTMVKEAYNAGVRSFVSKNDPASELISAVINAAQGKPYFVPRIAQELAAMNIRTEQPNPSDVLDARELQVFLRLAKGLTINEIAKELDLSTKTISGAVNLVKAKIHIDRYNEMTVLAIRHGLLDPAMKLGETKPALAVH